MYNLDIFKSIVHNDYDLIPKPCQLLKKLITPPFTIYKYNENK